MRLNRSFTSETNSSKHYLRAFYTLLLLSCLFKDDPIGSQDGKGLNAEVLVKYFNPCGCGTWLITEAEREGDDWRLYGYCHIFEWEWGYLLLSELESLRLPFGLGVERDLYTDGKYLRDFLSEEEIRQLEALG